MKFYDAARKPLSTGMGQLLPRQAPRDYGELSGNLGIERYKQHYLQMCKGALNVTATYVPQCV